jgi:chorismate mutase/prephenate dehydratase
VDEPQRTAIPRREHRASAMNDTRTPSAHDTPSDLGSLRAAIDAIDGEILALLNDRARIVQRVGALKRAVGAPIFHAARERDVIERLAEANPGPFPNAALSRVFREIISGTRSLEGPVRVAYLGPEGTFSHLAARAQFGGAAELFPTASIGEVFAEVERGRADLGVLPVENTTEGVVTQTLDAFVDRADAGLTICGEILLRIEQQLLSRSGERKDVKRVASISQALAQCRGWIERHLPGVERVETASTAAAAKLAAEDATVAAIGSALAAETWGLRVVEAGIEDRRDNTTRFVVVGREAAGPSGHDLTSVVFTVRKDESGTLHRLLEPFARHGVNLTSIQSRPLKGKPWEYLFFLDVEGHRSEPQVAKALDDAARTASSSVVLGSFPRAAAPGGGS